MSSADSVGEYVLTGRVLGQGSYGLVVEAEHSVSKDLVAIKYLAHTLVGAKAAGDETHICRKKDIDKEIHLQRRLNHKNVLNVLDVVEDVPFSSKLGTQYLATAIVMEKASQNLLGLRLLMAAQKKHFSDRLLRTYFKHLIETLEFCHSKGVVHRDLKSENLMLSENYILKVGDFGEGKIFEDNVFLTNTAEVGSGFYRAPEVMTLEEGKSYDPRKSDVWSCGVVLFVLATGTNPLNTHDDFFFRCLESYARSDFWEVHSAGHVFDLEFRDLINRMLEVDPRRRITIPGIKAHPWYKQASLSIQAMQSEMRTLERQISPAGAIESLEKQRQVDQEMRHKPSEIVQSRGADDDSEDDSSDDDDEEDVHMNQARNALMSSLDSKQVDVEEDLYDPDEDVDTFSPAERDFDLPPPNFNLKHWNHYCIKTPATLASVHWAVGRALRTFKPVVVKEAGDFKWSINAKATDLSAELHLYSMPESEEEQAGLMLELQHLKGPIGLHHQLYMHLLTLLTKYKVFRSAEEDEEEAEQGFGHF